jgi:predicted anti-sigma-YlaC factor YlaD
MKCSCIQRKLSAFLDNEVSNEEKRIILTHLQDCNVCQKKLEKLHQISASLDLLEEIEIPSYFMVRLKQRIAENKKSRFFSLPFPVWGRYVFAPVGIPVLFIVSMLIGSYLGTAINQKTSQVGKEFNTLFGITSLNNLPEGSVGDTYTYLLTEGGEK